MGVFVCCLCAQPTIVMGSAHKPIKNWYLFAIVWLASWMQVPLAFKAGCFGGHPSSGSLQTWGTICWVKTLHSSERNWELTSLLNVCHCIRGGVYDMFRCWYVSAFPPHFDVAFFLICPMSRSHSASFWILSEGIVPCVAVDLVCP